MKEYKIGEVFEYDGQKYVARENKQRDCRKCAFYAASLDFCQKLSCAHSGDDDMNIYFEKIENEKNENCDGDFCLKVKKIANEIVNMLIDKNTKYGNSALSPKRIFSKSDAVEQIKVRIDDKLSRIANESDDDDEDAISDLIGYLFLLKIAKGE